MEGIRNKSTIHPIKKRPSVKNQIVPVSGLP
jgi:hypothetical protein